ncbi:hypothetical protein BGZ73_000341 [Actinomortierella ambigua]|nr:hypothetical protein BGZ73_000341 [Actinomortierella ambigua]
MSRPSLRETIAAGRSRMAQNQQRSKAIRGGNNDESWAFQSSGVPGVPARRSNQSSFGYDDDHGVDSLGQPQKSIKSLIATAKGTGIMNLSNRGLTRVPMEIWGMYNVDPNKIVVDFNDTSNAWYNAVDLTRLIASDNQIDHIEDNIQEFGALTHVDFRNNMLKSLPPVMDQLAYLVVLHLNNNKFETVPQVIFSLPGLLELHLASNQIKGALSPLIGKLTKLETLDLSDNQIQELPEELGELQSLRKLALSKNQLTTLPATIVGKMKKLVELEVAENKLRFLLSDMAEGSSVTLPALVRLDAKRNAIQRVTNIANTADDKSSVLILPAVKEIHLSLNALQDLENLLYMTKQLSTLDLRHNRFMHLPRGVLELDTLRRLDMANNQMDDIPSALGNMTDLMTFVWEGNPVRNVPRSINTTEGLMKLLRQRLDSEENAQVDTSIGALAIADNEGAQHPTPISSATSSTHHAQHASRSVTPPPSHSPFHAQSPSTQAQSPRAGGSNTTVQNLNLANKALTEITEDDIAKNCMDPIKAILDSNALTAFPVALHTAYGTTTLTSISIHHNKLKEFPWELAFPFLTSLNLANNLLVNLITAADQLSPEAIGANYPRLSELDLTANRLQELPETLHQCFPRLKVVRAARNKIAVIHPAGLTGLETLDLSGNEIGTLPPLLGNVTSLKTLLLDGNLFRVPRRQILDQGTEAVLEYLRGRIPS